MSTRSSTPSFPRGRAACRAASAWQGICAALLGTAMAVQAQTPHIPDTAWRRGQPDVIAAPAAPASEARFQRGAFQAAYALAGQPAIAVLWNREFSDMLEQSSAVQLRMKSARQHASVAQEGGVQAARASQASVTTQRIKTAQARRSGPAEEVDLQMRAAFLQALTRGGARLVDRNVVMRTTAVRHKQQGEGAAGIGTGGLDSQQIETEALAQHAPLLLEVLNTPDANAPTGWATYVSIKRMADGVILLEDYLDGRLDADAPRPVPRFEAVDGEGFREVAPSTSIRDIGQRLGEATLARLGRALSH